MARLEDEGQIGIQILGMETVSPEHLLVECHDATGRDVKLPVLALDSRPAGR